MACERCDGTGFEIVQQDGKEFASPCRCRRGGDGAKPDDVFRGCRIPPRYQHCGFKEFSAGDPPLRAALEQALTYCSGFPHSGADQGMGILFTGDNGVGKTHLAVSILRELREQKGVKGQFWDFHELIREIKNSYNPETRTTELQVLEPVVETELLVLDDLGAWKMTDWMNDTLFYILNSRYMAQRATIITTNFQDIDPSVARKDGSFRTKEYLGERIGYRLRSRLLEMCVVIHMQGHDHRTTAQHGKSVALSGPRDRQR